MFDDDSPSVDADAFDFDAALILEAKSSNRAAAVQILREIGSMDPRSGLSTAVMAYLSECLKTWAESDFDPKEAARAFHVQRPKQRPPDSNSIKARHIRALRIYYLMRGRRKGREQAIQIAADAVHLSLQSIIRLLEAAGGGLTVEQGAALLQISKRVRGRCLNPPRKRYQRNH